MEPCGTKNVISLSFEYALFACTLKDLGCKYSLNHFRATSLIQNFLSNTESDISWSTVLKAALRFIRISVDTFPLSMAHNRSLAIFKSDV